MNPQSNESLLRRRLHNHLFNPSQPWESPQANEIISLLLNAISQLPPSHSRELRARYSDLFCPFCGELHKLIECQREGVVEYRVDPTAWMREHIPAGLMHSMAKVEVRPRKPRKAKGNVQSLNKTSMVEKVREEFKEAREEFDKMKEAVKATPEPNFDLVECPKCFNLVQPYADGTSSGHRGSCPNA